jgi:hypothetical protein
MREIKPRAWDKNLDRWVDFNNQNFSIQPNAIADVLTISCVDNMIISAIHRPQS